VRTELSDDGADDVGREATAAGVLEDGFRVVGVVDAVDLVAGDVAVAPGVGASQLRDGVVGLRGDPAQLLVGELAGTGISRSMM